VTSSPGTPTGTGRRRASTTYAFVFAIGRPIGIEPSAAGSSRGIAWQQVNVVFSVGPVAVDQLHGGRQVRVRAADVRDGERLAARQALRDSGERFRTLVDDRVEERRRQPQRRDLVLAQHALEPVARGHALGIEHELRAVQQRAPQLERRGVERDRRELQQRARRVEARVVRRVSTRRAIARCGTSTPFGCPVEPEVYIT
jgi:hypothetical protein